jgi:hypothetical protein
MQPVNLIPARRILARQRRGHLRACVALCSTWAVVVAGACAAGQGLLPLARPANAAGLAERLDRAAREIQTNEQAVAATKGELSAVQATLRATKGIAGQPDWSTLLALIARTTGDDVMLRWFDLQPAAAPAAAAAPAVKPGAKPGQPRPAASPRSPGYLLNLSGLAQSQPAVTQFVLRLERSGLFSRVTLLDTSREAFRDADATSFRVECVIDATTTVAPAGPAPSEAKPPAAGRASAQ